MHPEFVCDVCGKRFLTLKEVEKHEPRHKKEFVPTPKVERVYVYDDVDHSTPRYPDHVKVTFDDGFTRVYRVDD